MTNSTNGAGEPVLVSIGRTPYTCEITAEGHRSTADEPESLGGRGEGPTPYGYLLSSLGACVAITCRMYADRKGWALDGVHVAVAHSRASDHESIEIEVQFTGDLDDAQLGRLTDIAERCPVHRTITGDLRIGARRVDE